MQTKITIISLLMFLIYGCITPKYLPSADNITVNTHGSYIKVIRKKASNVKGELIAIDYNELIVLSGDSNKCVTIPVKDIKRFKLRVTEPKHYGWSIPVYTLLTATHGFFAILTAPINLIVTISVTVSGENAFKYSNKDMTYYKLRMFARFPQGVPPNVALNTIQ